MTIKILATADIHIGRRPTKIANSNDARRFSAARMWEAIVDRAIEEKVDLVALAGDVVDHDNRFFEAMGPLERGLTKLGSRLSIVLGWQLETTR